MLSIAQHLKLIPQTLRATALSYEQFIVQHQDDLQDEAMLAALLRVFTISQFVAGSCQREPELLIDLIRSGDLQRSYDDSVYQTKLQILAQEVSTQAVLQRRLRRLRRREFVRIAWRDLCGWASLTETMHDLSRFADQCITVVIDLLHRWQMRLYGNPVDEQGNIQPLLVVALGKLGGSELNFSSDIDLMLVYPVNGEISGSTQPLSHDQYFVRLAQAFIKVLSENTADGFVFRVDLRLRPYGEGGPLVLSFAALEAYYQEQGRDWERYALTKARLLGGRLRQREQLAGIINSFVYRRYLDYSTLTAMRTLKQLILRQVQTKGLQRDVKRGVGGIRQIEFIVQALQLIRGGREKNLQLPGIFAALNQLQQHGILTTDVVSHLRNAYELLRRTEHVLQMIADQQTHMLPTDEIERFRLVYALGFNDWRKLMIRLSRSQKFVENYFEQMLARSVDAAKNKALPLDDQLQAVWLGEITGLAAVRILRAAGFTDTEKAQQLLQMFHSGRRYKRASQLSRSRLDVLAPVLLRIIGKCTQPVATLARVMSLLESVVQRSTYLALLWENHQILARLVKLLDSSPWLAQQVIEHPLLLDELLHAETLNQPGTEPALMQALDQLLVQIPAFDQEEQIDSLRRFKLCQVLRVAAADVDNALSVMQVSDHLTHTAVVILRKIKQLALSDIHARYAHEAKKILSEQDFIIIAYGKLGGIELSYDSDLDLVFLHNNLAADGQITLRLAQRIIHLLTVRSRLGGLYQVDPRLRPSGSSGLLVSHIDAFIEYQQQQAWTWEHQALVRARVISGSGEIESRFNALRRSILQRKRQQSQLQQEVVVMRERMRAATEVKRAGMVDIRQCPGGITDIEFIVQYGVLAWAAQVPALTDDTDNCRILRKFSCHELMAEDDVQLLVEAYQCFRLQVHHCALQNQPALIAEDELPGLREGVCRIWQRLFDSNNERGM